MTWFGAPETPYETPPIVRSKTSLAPVTPSQAAVDPAYTNDAPTSIPPKTRERSDVPASDRAPSLNPRVYVISDVSEPTFDPMSVVSVNRAPPEPGSCPVSA